MVLVPDAHVSDQDTEKYPTHLPPKTTTTAVVSQARGSLFICKETEEGAGHSAEKGDRQSHTHHVPLSPDALK